MGQLDIDPRTLQLQCKRFVDAIYRNSKRADNADTIAEQLDAIDTDIPPDTTDIKQLLRRKLRLYGLRERVLEQRLATVTAAGTSDDPTRLRALLDQPEVVTLSNGRRINCYPITLVVANRMAIRNAIISKATEACQAMEAAAEFTKYGKLQAERLFQRKAMLYEVTRPTGHALLPTEPTWLGRPLYGLYAWLDGGNRFNYEARFLRWCLRVVFSLSRVLPDAWVAAVTGIPPARFWWLTQVDELLILRGNLAANDERAAGLPKLAASGPPDQWGWTGFAGAMAQARGGDAQQYIVDKGLVGMLWDFMLQAKRTQEQERQREAKGTTGKGKHAKRVKRTTI